VSRLELAGLTKRYEEREALAGIDLDVASGELLTVVGPSGSGKSTLLRLVAGLESPDGGAIALDGRDLAGVAPPDRGVAMIFQGFALFPHLTVEGNVGFGLRARGVPAAEVRERARDAAARLGLADALGRRPGALSGGERQRVALARALAARPRLLLLGEPLSNLDAPLRAQAREELRRLHAETDATMVHVTHDQAEALTLGQRVAVLAGGRLEQVGPPDAVYEHPATRFVAGFLGTPPMNLLDGRVQDGEAVAGPLRVAAPPGVADGEAVTVGVRPDDLVPGEAGTAAEVALVERAGREEVWRVHAGGEALWVRPPAGTRAQAGDRVRLGIRDARLFGGDGRAR